MTSRSASPPSDRSGGLDAFFSPRGIAVIGASPDRRRVGGRTLVNLPRFGFGGRVYPVTPSHSSILGYRCYPSVTDICDPVDLAVVCVSTERVPAALRECGAKGVRAAVVFASGFEQPRAGSGVAAEFAAAIAESGVRVIGPNTVGIRAVHNGVFATFAHDIEGGITPGSVAMIAQSGGLGVYFGSSYLRLRAVGTRYVVDTGNEFDVDAAEVLDHIAEDPEVSCVGLILEGSRDGRRLAEAVRRATGLGKPVLLLKTGHTRRAAAQIASHTGSLAGNADLFESALADAGARVVHDEMDMVDAMVIHSAGTAPRGRRLGIVTPSGGYAILTLDAAERYGMEVPEPELAPSADQEQALNSGHFDNPLDYTSTVSAGPHALEVSLEWMLSQPNIDAVLLWQAYSLLIDYRREELERVLRRVQGRFDTPVFGCGITTPEFEDTLRRLGMVWFSEPTRLVRALSIVTPPAPDPERRRQGGQHDRDAHDAGEPVIAGARARELLDRPGLEHVPSVAVVDSAEAAAWQRTWGTPVVLKVESDRVAHKSDLGLVAGPLEPAGLETAFDELAGIRARHGLDDAPIVVQRFERGVELALGAYLDPTFGPAVMIASGGVFLEILADAVFAPAPVTVGQAKDLIGRLRGAYLLAGARGRPRADVDAAAAALVGLSEFIAAADGAYRAVDINPLVVRSEGDGAVAVDALIVPAGTDAEGGPASAGPSWEEQ